MQRGATHLIIGAVRERGAVRRYFGSAATNKFNTRYHTIQKEILKYLKHYSKFHQVFIIWSKRDSKIENG